ncbi:MAG: TIGR02757 family protein [Bacteroidia bacterium]|nr:MAG: TIGR02757 family protein [Bacteroidia bacterium]
MTKIDGDIKAFLDEKVVLYNNPGFIDTDPISVPHRYSMKEDIEVAAFLTATISWGSRPMIIKNALRLLARMGDSPFDFVMNHKDHHLDVLDGFVHRTFCDADARYFIRALRHIYARHGGLESVFCRSAFHDSVIPAIIALHNLFFSLPHPERTRKHVSNPAGGSPAKRINMFLRWMVRDDGKGVDFGLWKSLSPSQLSCPLDLHTGHVARKFGLITVKQNNLKALRELDSKLRLMDPADPVKYDFALFGLGVFEEFWK